MTAPAKKLRVLVTDDDPAIRTLVARVFARHGFEVVSASDGVEAIAKLDAESFDLLVLDLMMPRIDGIGVIKHLEKRGDNTPPILVMTAAVPDILRRLPPERVASIITKPFDLDELMHEANEAIRTNGAPRT
jgi:two-component system response regulator MprA